MNDERKRQKNRKANRMMLFRSAAVTVVVFALIIGLTRAWFTNQTNIATLVPIVPPSKIAIKGPNGEALTELDLSYDKATDKQGDTVTIRRVISVESDSQKHQLEIAHTTNLKNLTFNLYRASKVSDGSTSDSTVTDKNYTYSYNPAQPISGKYINLDSTTNNYKYATDVRHAENYGTYEQVQAHAEPLYWLANEQSVNETTDKNTETDPEGKYLTCYVLEISWTETTKETDIFYLLARTVN